MGFPAYSERSSRFRGVPRKRLVRLAEDALDELGWCPVQDGKWRICASVPMGFYIIFLTWGAKFTIEVEEEELFIRSEGIIPIEWLDVGQHDHNIKQFLNRFEDLLEEEE